MITINIDEAIWEEIKECLKQMKQDNTTITKSLEKRINRMDCGWMTTPERSHLNTMKELRTITSNNVQHLQFVYKKLFSKKIKKSQELDND